MQRARAKVVIHIKQSTVKAGVGFLALLTLLISTGWLPHIPTTPEPKKAHASYQFHPTGGAIVTGNAPAVLGATVAATEGVNLGDYKATEADDNLHWGITSTASGYNAYIDLDGVQLNGANKFIIQTEFDLDATIPQTLVQICDWTSSTGVDNAADGQCSGGGWRTLNINNVAINTATAGVAYDWQIYDGYWNSTSVAKIDTPLTNFVNTGSGNKVRIRYFSTTSSAGSIANIDFLRMFAVVNPLYSPSSATILSGSAVSSDYSMTAIGGFTQTGSDDARFRVAGTAGTIADFYQSYTNVKTYTGANTILVRAEYSCSATGINIRPKIWNFTLSQWEDLTTASIACSATDGANAWAKNSILMSDYVSGGEVRVGWRGLANGTQEIRLDTSYIMIGSVNTSGTSEISMGTNSANSVTNTRDLDITGTTNTWTVATQDESNTASNNMYGYDSDHDGVVEEAASMNFDVPITVPSGSAVTAIFFAGRYIAGTGLSAQIMIEDYSAATSVNGGWSATSGGGGGTLYSDNLTVNTVQSGGGAGFYTNPEDHIDTVNDVANLRLRTTLGGAIANNATIQWDFGMVSIQWTEDASHPSTQYQFHPTGGATITGTAPARLQATAPGTEGVNLGDYRATLSDDNLHWGITSTASGFDAYIDIGDVALNGANKIILQTEFDLDATAPTTLVQVCDWVSSTGVHNAADAQCTGGGWRNLNLNDVGITTVTPTAYDWQIYNGYWNTSATGNINTPLTNFVNGSGDMRVRFFSTTNTVSTVHIDYLRAFAVINPVYAPSGATQITGGTIAGDYSLAVIGGAGQTGSDDARFRVPGTVGVPADFYFSITDVETYTGANTILMRAEYSCSTTGTNHRPKIWNFNTSAWEDLTTASIACSATDAANAWAKNNVNIAHYVSNGEIRIGWRALTNTTTEIRIDMLYVMLGTTNTDGTSEISFGTNSANSVTNTRDLDITGTSNTWSIAAADESNTQSFSTYGYDNDNDAVVEEATAANINFDVTLPSSAAATGVFFAGRFMSGTGGTVQLGIDDYSGATSVIGGWSVVGAGATTAQVYTDNITVASVLSGGSVGFNTNPEDHIDTISNKMNLRLRTTASAASTTNTVAQWDFAMVAPQWVETTVAPSLTFATDQDDFPTLVAGNPVFATSTLSVDTANVSGWTVNLSGDDRATGNTVLDLTTNAAVGITDQLEWIPGAATTTAGNAVRMSSFDNSGDVLAFRVMTASGTPRFQAPTWWGSLDTYADNASTLWAGLSSSTAANLKIGNSSLSSGGGPALSTVLFHLDVPGGQATGAYTGGITYTATVNP